MRPDEQEQREAILYEILAQVAVKIGFEQMMILKSELGLK